MQQLPVLQMEDILSVLAVPQKMTLSPVCMGMYKFIYWMRFGTFIDPLDTLLF